MLWEIGELDSEAKTEGEIELKEKCRLSHDSESKIHR